MFKKDMEIYYFFEDTILDLIKKKGNIHVRKGSGIYIHMENKLTHQQSRLLIKHKQESRHEVWKPFLKFPPDFCNSGFIR
jgi:hypothetical protein